MNVKNRSSNSSDDETAAEDPLDFSGARGYATRGTGENVTGRLKALGAGTVVEAGVRLFHPENIEIGANAFVGHDAHLDGYHKGFIRIGEGSWIGQGAFIHGAGGVAVGRSVGIGPRVVILTSEHELSRTDIPVLHAPLSFAPVTINDGADIGAGAIVLPGCEIGPGAVIGAGAVVTGDVPPRGLAVGNPARVIRRR